MAQTTRTRARMCLFWNFSHCSPFRGLKPQKTILGAWIGVFKPKSRNRKNVHIIKTTASIPTEFCTVIKTTKCPSWVVLTHAWQIQDGGRPPSLKNWKIAISQPRLERFWRSLAGWCSSTFLTVRPLKMWNFKNPRWRRPRSWKIEKSPYLGRGLIDFVEIWHADAVRLSLPFRPLKILKFRKFKVAAAAILKNPKSRYLANGLTDRHEIWHGDEIRHFRPS